MKKYIKILSLYLFLKFIFLTNILADTIRDFEMEGMSIGQSLLDHYDLDKIKKSKKNTYKLKDFITVYVEKKFNDYNLIMVSVKVNENYKIYSLTGILDYKNNIQECYGRMEKITDQIQINFPSNKFIKEKTHHPVDKTKKSLLAQNFIKLKDGNILIGCTDYSKEYEKKNGRNDFLMVSIKSIEFEEFLTKAYK